MLGLIRFIDALNERVGRLTAWTAIVMVVIQFWVVIMRYVFAIGSIPVQESIWYMHGILFMVGAGYTLLHNGHVRIDVWYRDAPRRSKAWVDLLGVVFFLLPVMIYAWVMAYPYVENSWRVFEGSTEAGGLPFIWALKTVVLVMIALFALQGISLALQAFLVLIGRGDEVGEQESKERF